MEWKWKCQCHIGIGDTHDDIFADNIKSSSASMDGRIKQLISGILIRNCSFMHVDVWGMWVVFGSFSMFSNFYQLDLINKNPGTLATLQWNICKSWISPYLVMAIRSACLFGFLSGYTHRSSQLCYSSECRADLHVRRRSPVSFKHLSLHCLFFDPHWTTYESNIGVQLRKWTTWDPSTLDFDAFQHRRIS